MSLEAILAELPQLTDQERAIVTDMICDLSDGLAREKLGPSKLPPALPPRDYWTKIFEGWAGEGEEDLPEDLSLNHDRYVNGVPGNGERRLR